MTTTAELRPSASRGTRDAEPRSDDASIGGSHGTGDRRRLSTLLVALVAMSPFVVGAYSIVARGFPPGALFGDRALLGLAAIDAWRAPVLLGAYSRFFWHHPGPLYFYLLHAWSTVFGQNTVGLVLGVVAINAAAAGGILFVAYRRGGRALLVWASLLLTAYLVAVEPIPFDIWNPSVTLLPFALALLLAWSVTCRDWWAAPWLALVACFAVQTHVGLAPGVAMAIVFAAVVSVLQHRRRDVPLEPRERRTVRRAVVASLVVAVVAWIPPLVEQFTSRDGNLTLLWQFFTRPGSPHTLSEGLENTALQATLMVRSLFQPVSLTADGHQGLTVALVVSAIAFVAAVTVARKVRATDALVLLAFAAVELAVGVYAVSRVVGPIQFYLVQWISAVGFVLWLAVGNAAIVFGRARWSGRSWSPTLTRSVAVLLLALLCVGALRAFPGDAGQKNEDLDVPNNRDLFGYVPTKPLLAATKAGHTVVLRMDSITAWEVMAADALLLVQNGRTVKVVDSPVTRLLFDDSLRVHDAGHSQVLAFVTGRNRVSVVVRLGSPTRASGPS